jgi:thiol-disulfide isomerase/thioredoxin
VKRSLALTIVAVVMVMAAVVVDSCSKDSQIEFKKRDAAADVSQSGTARSQANPQKAPGFQLADVASGKTVDFSQFDGKVVLVDFWATWCPPCRRSIPDLSDMQAKYADRGFTVVGVSVDQGGPEKVAQFAKQMQIPYTIVLGNAQVANDWQIGSAIPVAYLVDRKGAIVDRFVGYQDRSVLEQKIQKFL